MLISVVMLLAVVSLAVSLVTRRTEPATTSTAPGPGPGVKQVRPRYQHQSIHLVMFQLRLGSSGIVRSYAKIPVEIKNMLPSNVAYQQLYDV